MEGAKDEMALEEAEIHAETLQVRGETAAKIVEKICEKLEARGGQTPEEKEVVLLTDFDAEGERKERELKQALRERGVRISEPLRKAVKTLFGIRTVEQLPSALEKLGKKIGQNRD